MTSRFLPFTVTVCGIDELRLHAQAGVTHVLSILDPETPEPRAFAGFADHTRVELRFHDVIEETAGQIAPEVADVERILAFGRGLMTRPEQVGHLLVHCHVGISRSTAALTMLLAQSAPERPAAEVVDAVVGIRDKAWPNLRLIEFADAALGRRGDLVAAVRARHRSYGERYPEVVTFMRENGRRREVDWADR